MAPRETWQSLGSPPPATLTEATRQLHWAAQLVASTGFSFLPARDDFDHTTLVWEPASRAFVRDLAGASHPFSVALCPADLSVQLRGADGGTLDTLALDGHTLDAAYRWLADATARFQGRDPEPLVRPSHDMPSHPIQHGEAFHADDPAAREELARLYGNTSTVLAEVADGTAGASPVRIWPHHFDQATLVSLDDEVGEQARSIGIGMAPADGTLDEPYWYVTPWPRPAQGLESLVPPAPGAHWNTQDWFGAVLPASAVTTLTDGPQQRERVMAFITTAVATGRQLLETR